MTVTAISVPLLHPIVVTSSGQLVCDERRLKACKQLGWTEIPVTVAENLDDVLARAQAEAEENTCRYAIHASVQRTQDCKTVIKGVTGRFTGTVTNGQSASN